MHKILQDKSLHLAKAIELAEMTVLQLLEMKNESCFDSLFSEIMEFASLNNFHIPKKAKGRPSKYKSIDS